MPYTVELKKQILNNIDLFEDSRLIMNEVDAEMGTKIYKCVETLTNEYNVNKDGQDRLNFVDTPNPYDICLIQNTWIGEKGDALAWISLDHSQEIGHKHYWTQILLGKTESIKACFSIRFDSRKFGYKAARTFGKLLEETFYRLNFGQLDFALENITDSRGFFQEKKILSPFTIKYKTFLEEYPDLTTSLDPVKIAIQRIFDNLSRLNEMIGVFKKYALISSDKTANDLLDM